MSNLINIETKNINDSLIQTVNARDLHEFLESKQKFADWIKDRIQQYGFIESQDFIVILGKTPNGGRPTKEYAISLDMAKELSMVERNEKGKQARQYFTRVSQSPKKKYKFKNKKKSGCSYFVGLSMY
ncbi:antA/AntB antirepressor family protein [Arsenophonus sp. PmNCSU2021_1]|uniref:antA/AntB antirepressor family protein n=1 Tax=Arsenophonus sp. PmNCSU2021_1 TaxID=3118989 RepID=UPI002FEFE132